MQDRRHTAIRLHRLIGAALVLLLFTDCTHARPSFDLFDEQAVLKPGSLAVLSGTRNELDVLLARSVTAELRQKSPFKVLSQDEVATMLPGYPLTMIQTDEKDSIHENRFSKALADSAHGKLKTTYLLIVWTEELTKSTSAANGIPYHFNFSAYMIASLLAYPGGNQTGAASFLQERGMSLFSRLNDAGVIEKMVEEGGQEMASSFLRAVTHK